MTEYAIEKGVPLPLGAGKAGRPQGGRLLAIRQMEVGDSVFFPKTTTQIALASARRVRAVEKSSLKVTARKVEGGVRIWRIA